MLEIFTGISNDFLGVLLGFYIGSPDILLDFDLDLILIWIWLDFDLIWIWI